MKVKKVVRSKDGKGLKVAVPLGAAARAAFPRADCKQQRSTLRLRLR